MRSVRAILCATLAVAFAPLAQGGSFDGTKPLICAPVRAMDCAIGEQCVTGTPDEIGAPNFLRIDFDKKVVVGPQRTSPVMSADKNDKQILLQGNELGYAWTIALDQGNGKMVVTLVDRAGAFVLFGSCTPL